MPPCYTVEELAKELAKELVKEDRVLALRAKEASGDIHKIWQEQQVKYEDLGIYETVVDEEMAEQFWKHMDMLDTVTFSSASGVKAFFTVKQHCEDKGERQKLPRNIICIGQKTKETLREYLPREDFDKIITAGEYTVSGLIQACMET